MSAAIGALALVALVTPMAQADSSSRAQADRTAPSSPGPIVLKGATQTSVTIAWLHATDDVEVTEYGVLWDSSRPKDTERTPLTTFTKSGLSCGTSYTVAVTAFDAAGNHSNEPSLAVVSTGACLDTSPPSAPSGVTMVAQTATSATLSWTPSTDNVGVAGYVISKSGIPLGTTSGTSYTVGDLTCGSVYSVVLQAYDVAGNRSAPTGFNGTTSSCADATPPKPPSGLSQVDRTATSMTISWSASTDASGIAGYGVYVDGARVASPPATSATVPSLACGKTYTIAVDAVDGAGNRSSKTSAAMPTSACPPSGGTSDTKPPSAPQQLRVTSASLGSASLAWNASTDNVAVTGYSVYHGGGWVGDTPGTSFLVSSVPCGTTATLGVEAHDAAGNHSDRTSVSVATHQCANTTAPTTPGAVMLQNRTETSLTVSWAPSTDTSGIAGYGAYLDGVRLATVPATQYTFSGLTCGKSYTLGVDAVDNEGTRSARSSTMLSTAACSDVVPPTKPSGVKASGVTATTLTLSWLASTDVVGVKGYDVYVGSARAATTTSLSVALGSLGCGKTITLGVEAFDASGNRSERATLGVTMAACGGTVTGDLYVSTGGSDGNPCTAAAPCSSLNRAYQLAQPGSTVVVAPGSYGAQAIDWRASMAGKSCDPLGEWGAQNTSDCITFDLTAPGIAFGNVELEASGIYLKGQASGGIPGPGRTYTATVKGEIYVQTDDAGQSPDHVTVSGLDANALAIYDADHVLYKNLDAGARTSVGGCGYIDPDTGASLPGIDESKIGSRLGIIPSAVVMDGIYFHDVNRTPAGGVSDCHDGALFFINGDGVTLRNSVWSQNWVYDIQVQAFNGRGMPTNVLIENNWFGCGVETYSNTSNAPNICNGQSAIQFDGSVSNWLIRYNTAGPGASLLGCYAAPCNFANVRAVGNLGSRSWNCTSGIAYGYNAFTEGPCGSTDKLWAGSLVSTSPGSENFTLASAGAASNLVSASGSDYDVSSDITGQSRSVPRDAGASEVG